MAPSVDLDLIDNGAISALLGPADDSGAARLSAAWDTQL